VEYAYSLNLFDDFVQALLGPDLVILLDVYSAGEVALPMFDSKALLQALRIRGANGFYADNLEQLNEIAGDVLQDDDVVLGAEVISSRK